MAKIFLISFLASGSLYFIWIAISQIAKSTDKINSYKALNKKIRKWPRVSAKVIELGYNLDYCYPGIVHNVEHIDGSLAKEAELFRLADEQQEMIDNESLYGKVLVRYVYSADGVDLCSRTISPIPSELDLKILYRLKAGSKIKIYVNPDDSTESYIKNASNELFEEMSNQMIIDKIKYFAYALILAILSIQALSSDLPSL